jgi:prolipoprotein diacylglyceryltransferase
LIFIVLHTLYIRKGTKLPIGVLSGLFFSLIFGARFLIEFVKERHVPFEMGLPLSMGQILSIPVVAFGIGGIWMAYRRERTPAK